MYRIYIRVSTSKQNLDAQKPDLEHLATTHSPCQWYEDHFTGKTLDRPGFNDLLNDLKAGDTVVVWRLDRCARSAHGLLSLLADLDKRGVFFRSLRDGIDTTAGGSPTTRLLIGVLASVAQFETEVRGERVAAGIAAKRIRGEKWNNGRKVGSCNVLTPETRGTIQTLRDRGVSISAIARQLKISRPSVYTALGGNSPV